MAARFMAEEQRATAEQQALVLDRGCKAGDAVSCFGLATLAIEKRLPDKSAAYGRQLRLIACSTAPLPEGCEEKQP
jgi:hypothetical protein